MPPGNDPVTEVPGLLAPTGGPTRVRYIVLGLTIGAYMITYIDRVVISSAVPSIQKEFGFSIVTMGWILSSFQWAYALFQIPGGWLGDRIGPRRALTLIVSWWSLFTCATVLAWSAGSMAVDSLSFWHGRGGCFSDCYPVAFPLDVAHGARFCPGRHPRRLPARGRSYAGSGGAHHRPLWMARGLSLLRFAGIDLGCGLVLVLPRHSG